MRICDITTEAEAVLVARQELKQHGILEDLKVIAAFEAGPKDISLKREGWLVAFKLNVPEGFDPDILFVELYPSIDESRIPDIL